MVKPLAASLKAVVSFTEQNCQSKYTNHLSIVRHGIGSLCWVAVAPDPAAYIKRKFDQALQHGFEVFEVYREQHVHMKWEWAYTEAIRELQKYIETYQSKGLVWNPDGNVLTLASSPPKQPGGIPAPLPPPALVTPSEDTPSSSSETRGFLSAPWFGVKTVAKEHPKIDFQNDKWTVEHYENSRQLEVTTTEFTGSVHVYKCRNYSFCICTHEQTLRVKGKFHRITIERCNRVNVMFNDAIFCAEIKNSKSIKVQILGKYPTVSIDKTDGCQVYLS